jgi:hypothetical protein
MVKPANALGPMVSFNEGGTCKRSGFLDFFYRFPEAPGFYLNLFRTYSSMDRILASEAGDPGSTPGGCTTLFPLLVVCRQRLLAIRDAAPPGAC